MGSEAGQPEKGPYLNLLAVVKRAASLSTKPQNHLSGHLLDPGSRRTHANSTSIVNSGSTTALELPAVDLTAVLFVASCALWSKACHGKKAEY